MDMHLWGNSPKPDASDFLPRRAATLRRELAAATQAELEEALGAQSDAQLDLVRFLALSIAQEREYGGATIAEPLFVDPRQLALLEVA